MRSVGTARGWQRASGAGLLYDPERVGVVFGSDYMLTAPEEFISAMKACPPASGISNFLRWAGTGMTQLSPLWLLKYLPNMPASHIAIYNDFAAPTIH